MRRDTTERIPRILQLSPILRQALIFLDNFYKEVGTMFTMLTSRSLKVMVLIVGFLVAGLGLYVAFQVQDAEATHSSLTCLIKQHRPAGTTYSYSNTPTGNTRTKNMNCSDCRGQPKKSHTQHEVLSTTYTHDHHEHKYIWESTWSYCHAHVWASSWSYIWVTQHCGG